MEQKFTSHRGKINPEKRAAMQRMIEAGADMETVARELGYKSRHTALCQAWHWGLHKLRRESFYQRQPRAHGP